MAEGGAPQDDEHSRADVERLLVSKKAEMT
jgi:hypothetical protein